MLLKGCSACLFTVCVSSSVFPLLVWSFSSVPDCIICICAFGFCVPLMHDQCECLGICCSMLDEPHAKETHRCLQPTVVDPSVQITLIWTQVLHVLSFLILCCRILVHFFWFNVDSRANSSMPMDTFESFGLESSKTDLNAVFLMIFSECCSADLRFCSFSFDEKCFISAGLMLSFFSFVKYIFSFL